MKEILIIDDETDITELLSDIFEDEGYKTAVSHNTTSALEKLEASQKPSAIILDIWLEGSEMDGIGLLKVIKSKYPNIPVIMISGHGNIDVAIQTIKYGAYNFIEKPFKAEKLLITLQRAIEAASLAKENFMLKRDSVKNILPSKSNSLKQIQEQVSKIAPTNSRVLIKGEYGTEKEAIARLIHSKSKIADSAFIAFSPLGLSPKEIEEKLFIGNKNIQPIVEEAKGCTLYMEDISSISFGAQEKLLNLLQGNLLDDIRFVVSMNMNDKKMNKNLLERLSSHIIEIPPLRKRKEDIKEITENILNSTLDGKKITISEEVYHALFSCDWPGNTKQLQNTIEQMLLKKHSSSSETDSKVITADLLPQEIIGSLNNANEKLNPMSSDIITKPLKEAREVFEAEYIKIQLQRFHGNIMETANFLGIDRTSLHRKIKSLGLTAIQE